MHAISRRLALLALGALTMFGTTACGDDEPSGPGASVAGTYNLSTVNGDPIPSTVYEGSDLGFYYKVEVVSGVLTLRANGTFDDVTTIRETEGTSAPESSVVQASGTFVRAGNTLTLTEQESGEPYTLTVQGDGSLVQSDDFGGFPITARYVKR